MRNSLELLVQDSKAMCKVFPTTFQGSIRAWYHSLKPGSISGFSYLYDKLITRFSTSIPTKRFNWNFLHYSTRKKNDRAYLKRFNKEMLHVKNLLKHITTKALINGVYNYFLWKMLYTLSEKNFLSIKHTMENYIWVEEDSMIRQGHPPFHKQVESLASHQSRTRTSKRNTEKHIYDCLTFPKLITIPLITPFHE